MNAIHRLRIRTKEHTALICILLIAVILRLPGLTYGLPLMLIADEPSVILGALKMLELHTLLPAHHLADFAAVLYYPPYLSYLYLLPFALIIGFKYLLWHGASALFIPQLVADLSAFFIAARALNILIGGASLILTYATAQSLFRSRRAALVSTFLLATSLAHIALSMTSRHWSAVTFLTVSTLWVLTHERLPQEKRYGYALIIAGFGMGISTISVLLLIPIALHFIFMRTITVRGLLRAPLIWWCAIISCILALLPSLLYPKSNGFVADITVAHGKSVIDFLISPIRFTGSLFPAEPVLIGLALCGLIILWRTKRNLCAVATTWIILYSWIFYLFFRFETRFWLPLFPLFALLGGYACTRWRHTPIYNTVILLILALPFSAGLRLAWLVSQNDTRVHAQEWVHDHLPPHARILVYANLTRIPTSQAAIQELRTIDASALRKVDMAESTLDNTDNPHALNLYTVNDTDFFQMLPLYAREHHYTYLLVDTSTRSMDPLREAVFQRLMSTGTLQVHWTSLGEGTSLGGSSFRDPFWHLFSDGLLGPNIAIYTLNQ